jgi:hypothetical protein
MLLPGMLSRVALVRYNVSEERIASIIRAFLCSLFHLLLTAIFVSSLPIVANLVTEAIRSSRTSVITKATLRNIQTKTFFLSRGAKVF